MKTKRVLLTIILLFSILLFKAQDKYEFMVINYIPGKKQIGVSIDGKQFITEEAVLTEKGEGNQLNANPLLKKISEFQEQGWEVISFNNSAFGPTYYEKYVAFLKKKKEK